MWTNRHWPLAKKNKEYACMVANTNDIGAKFRIRIELDLKLCWQNTQNISSKSNELLRLTQESLLTLALVRFSR